MKRNFRLPFMVDKQGGRWYIMNQGTIHKRWYVERKFDSRSNSYYLCHFAVEFVDRVVMFDSLDNALFYLCEMYAYRFEKGVEL